MDWSRDALCHGSARGLVVDGGNANAFTGAKGRCATEQTARCGRGVGLRAARCWQIRRCCACNGHELPALSRRRLRPS
ncbi:hypothetical protein N5B53_09875 [Shinella kummerowiae]|nr:hypothetical protein [Shinella kummerowiae]